MQVGIRDCEFNILETRKNKPRQSRSWVVTGAPYKNEVEKSLHKKIGKFLKRKKKIKGSDNM